MELKGSAVSGIVPPAVQGQPAPKATNVRNLRMGDTVNQGETIQTKPMSSVILRFEDGQVVALAANSAFKIDSYVFNRAEPTKSNVLMTLVVGGMRAATGLIGKAKPENVNYKAGNATIGVRGTDITFMFNGQTLVVKVEAGQITFQANGKSVTISAAEGTLLDTTNPNAPVLRLSNADLRAAIRAADAVSTTSRERTGALGFVVTDILVDTTFGDLIANLASGSQRVLFGSSGLTGYGSVGDDQSRFAFVLGTGAGAGVTGISSSSAGGSTLPNCNLVVSPVRGTNCQ